MNEYFRNFRTYVCGYDHSYFNQCYQIPFKYFQERSCCQLMGAQLKALFLLYLNPQKSVVWGEVKDGHHPHVPAWAKVFLLTSEGKVQFPLFE